MITYLFESKSIDIFRVMNFFMPDYELLQIYRVLNLLQFFLAKTLFIWCVLMKMKIWSHWLCSVCCCWRSSPRLMRCLLLLLRSRICGVSTLRPRGCKDRSQLIFPIQLVLHKSLNKAVCCVFTSYKKKICSRNF